MIVIDASAIVEVVLGLPGAEGVDTRIGASTETLHAPHLLPAEVAQVVRRFERRGDIDASRGAAALAGAADFEIHYYDHLPLVPRVWELRANLTAYDGLYVALAEALRAPLLTCDERIATAPGHRATVELVAQP